MNNGLKSLDDTLYLISLIKPKLKKVLDLFYRIFYLNIGMS